MWKLDVLQYPLQQPLIAIAVLDIIQTRGPSNTELAKLVVFETGGVALARDAARNYASFGVVVIRCERTIDWLIATFCLRDVA